jgi:hypothetical protein
METSSPPAGATSPWKRIAIVSFFAGLGITLAAALALGSFIWYQARPAPPKPWNTSALVATKPPSFVVSDDGKSLQLGYSVRNNTDVDYSLDDVTAKKLRVMAKFQNGELSTTNNVVKYSDTPIFMPARQTASLNLSVDLPNLPMRKGAETPDDYHERLRTHLKTEYSEFAGIVLYDEANRYQINLPKWADKKPAN